MLRCSVRPDGGQVADVVAQGLVVALEQAPHLDGHVVEVEDEAVERLVVVGQHARTPARSCAPAPGWSRCGRPACADSSASESTMAPISSPLSASTPRVSEARADEVVDLRALAVDDLGQVGDQVGGVLRVDGPDVVLEAPEQLVHLEGDLGAVGRDDVAVLQRRPVVVHRAELDVALAQGGHRDDDGVGVGRAARRRPRCRIVDPDGVAVVLDVGDLARPRCRAGARASPGTRRWPG